MAIDVIVDTVDGAVVNMSAEVLRIGAQLRQIEQAHVFDPPAQWALS